MHEFGGVLEKVLLQITSGASKDIKVGGLLQLALVS